MHIPWDDLRVYLAVAEAGSLSGAARRLGITQPTVSRRVAELEAMLGEPLFLRSDGGAALTPFGAGMLGPARRMAECAADAERAVQRAEAAPSGSVRITAPPGVAFEFLAPFAAWLRDRLPLVRLEVLADVEYLDLSRREADLALRGKGPTQRDLVSLASLDHEVAAFASASYVRTLPPGYGVGDVAWIGWAAPFEARSPNKELAAAIPGFAPAFASDDFLIQLRAAEAGLGAMFLGRVRHRFSPPTSLVELDLDFGDLRGELHLVAARAALEVPRIKAVAELLAAELGRAEAPRRRR